MRRIVHLIVVVALATALPVHAQSQAPRSERKAAKGKLLVSRLPDGVEGVVLEKGRLKLKPGYKFVRQSRNSVAVERMAGGGGGGGSQGIKGSFQCFCSDVFEGGGEGGCSLNQTPTSLSCMKSTENGCRGSCELSTIVAGIRKGLILY
jgi:hypothetical protein